jgi:hypothetical protein
VRKRFVVSGLAGAAAAGVLVAVLWTGSGSGADRTGPLGGGPVNGTQCASGRQSISVAMDNLQNATTSPIQVDKFVLVNAHGVRLLGVDLAPVVSPGGGYDLLVTGGTYPPSSKDLAASADVHWSERRALPMTMPPDQPGHSWNLVFGLERTAATGTADYQLQYEWRGNQYIWLAPTALKLTAGPCP